MQNIWPPDAVVPIAAYICCFGVVDGSAAAAIAMASNTWLQRNAYKYLLMHEIM